MYDTVRVNTVRNEDAMVGFRYQLQEALSESHRVGFALLEYALREGDLPIEKTPWGLRAELQGGLPGPDRYFGAALDEPWPEAPMAAMLFTGRALYRFRKRLTGRYHFCYSYTAETLPRQAARIRLSEAGELGTAFFVNWPQAKPVWESCYGEGTAVSLEGTVCSAEIGVRRESPFDTGEDNGEQRFSTDGALSYLLSFFLTLALYGDAETKQ